MSVDQFRRSYFPIPQWGFTAIEAVQFLRKEFPTVGTWTCWTPGYGTCRVLGQIVGKGQLTAGRIGPWSWKRVRCSYPQLAFWDGFCLDPASSDDWVGALKMRGKGGEEFLLFSFLNSQGEVGHWYLASTHDVQVLDRFARDVHDHFNPSDQLVIHVYGAPGIHLDPTRNETIFLAEPLRQDIERQVDSFFANVGRYRQLGLRHRRGFLFVGGPGNGKTLLLRHLVRQCHRRYKVPAFLLAIDKHTQNADLTMFFRDAERHAPCLVIMEDLDSLTRECHVTRSHLLAQLDGLDMKEGLLVIGTTNHPEDLDPALLHRPSRFDRVWHFPAPDMDLRRRYLQWAFDGVDVNTIEAIARQTAEWSFAYLQELRTTTAILAIDRSAAMLTAEDLNNAFALLAPQFQAGRMNHILNAKGNLAGFCEA